MIPRALLAVVTLLVWYHVPDRSKVMTWTKRDTLVLQVGGWAWGWHSHPVKLVFVEKPLKLETGQKQRQHSMNKDQLVEMWNVLSMYRIGTLQNPIEVMQEYMIDLLAAQEVRWLGRAYCRKGLQNRIQLWCWTYFGAGFIVSKHIRSRVIIFKPIDMRLWVLRIRGEFKYYSFICAPILM